jgi:hypothetical protein
MSLKYKLMIPVNNNIEFVSLRFGEPEVKDAVVCCAISTCNDPHPISVGVQNGCIMRSSVIMGWWYLEGKNGKLSKFSH